MFEQMLINEVEKFPFLFNKCHPLYRNKLLKKKAWSKIGAALYESPKHCFKIWKTLRERYVKETTMESVSLSTEPEEQEQWKAPSYLNERLTPKQTSIENNDIPVTEPEPIHRTNIHSHCRTCLTDLSSTISNNEIIYDIHQTEDLSKWIVVCTSMEVDSTDDYPKYLCQSCFTNFQSFYDFRRMCIRSMRILDNILYANGYASNDDNPTFDDMPQDYGDAKEEPIGSDEEVKDETEDIESESLIDHRENSAEDKILVKSLDSVKFESTNLDREKFKSSELENNDESSYTFKLEIELHKEENKEQKDDEQFLSFEKSQNKAASFQCKLCMKRFYSQDSLEIHMQVHQGFQRYQCSQCNCSYKRVSHLKAHIRDIHQRPEDHLICSIEGCGKQFKHIRTFRAHYRLHHTKANAKRENCTAFICEDCGRFYKNLISLKRHRFTHTSMEEYPFKCEQCGKGYTEKRRYKEHLARHTEDKKYECTYCGVRKETRSELNSHINEHTKENQWSCPHCPSFFSSSDKLSLHDRVVHNGVRRYACRYCEQRFGSSKTLKHHEMRHTGEKPHTCHICGKRFIQLVALQAHVKTHDRIDGRRESTRSRETNSPTDFDSVVEMCFEEELDVT